ncbi:MAG: anthranilate phosphoribosyltransferase [Candidatus Anstonellales archaeon]
MLKLLKRVVDGKNLNSDQAAQAMRLIIGGSLSPVLTASFLTAMRMKGETEEELASFALVMRQNATRIYPRVSRKLVDTCGTGGDNSGTFNISTIAAFIAAGAGVPIAKHGNRAVSSFCGSADVLEALGAKMLEPKKVEECISKIGVGFMFAPFFHPAMKNVMPIRKELGFRTFFNLLGPLTNPAGATAQVLGVFSPALLEKFASVLLHLGSESAMVVHSEGMDEIGLGKTNICEIKGGKIKKYDFEASSFGFSKAPLPHPSDRKDAANIMLHILSGKEEGPGRDCAILNAAAAIYVGGKATSLKQGVMLAEKSLSSELAYEKLKQFISFTNRC